MNKVKNFTKNMINYIKNNPMDYIDVSNHIYYKSNSKKDTLNFSISMGIVDKKLL